MSQTSRPWAGTSPGDAGSYSAQQWQQLYQSIVGLGASRPNVGPLLGSGTQPDDGLKVQAQSPATTSVDVLAGSALIQGVAYINTATVPFTIAANSSGNPRIDTVVVRADYALQTVRLAVLQGTPAVTPSTPTLTQSANVMWEIPLADIAVATGFTSIVKANITPRHEWANAAAGVYLDNILNNSGVTLQDGDVVIWDTSTDRAVITTTTADDVLLAGVWRGRTANGSYGRVQVQGVGYVNANAAITRGAILVTSTTAKQAGVPTSFSVGAELGRALETTVGSGYVLASFNVRRTAIRQGYQSVAAPIGYSVSNAYTGNYILTAVSGTVLIPITLSGPMLLQSVQVLNNDTATQRTWRWDLYADLDNNNNAIQRVATCSAPETFTPSAASVRTIAVSGAPVFLPPGNYYLAIQNTHASNTFNLGATNVGGNFTVTTSKTKTTGSTNGATLDIIAATWTASFVTPAVNLRGRAAGDTIAW
jgi:hypothetical protein